VVVLGLVAFLWAFTRDTNGWILLMVAGLILLAVLLFKAKKVYLVLAVLFSFIFALGDLSAETGVRWVFPFQNVLAQRILTGQASLAFFEQCGMPLTPELLELAGGFANSADRAFYDEPALQPYRVWLHANGRDCYMRWLLSRPLASLREPWTDFTGLLAFEDVATFFPQRYEPVLPWYVERVLYPQDALLLLWSGTTVAALVAIWKKAWRANPAWAVFIGLCLLTYPHVVIVWHGDVPGTQRHALSASLQFVLSLWMFGFLFLEILITKFKARGYL
jgi:hypothetical protein